MKKIKVILCALALCLYASCIDTCGFSGGEPNTTYTWSYTNNGVTSAGEFTTNDYGQASFDVPEDVECNRVELKKLDGGNALPVAPPDN
jgi:hypothetical protein